MLKLHDSLQGSYLSGMRIILLLLFSVVEVFSALPTNTYQHPFLLRIPKSSTESEVGSGFIFSHTNGHFLVTARHVLFDRVGSNSWALKGTNLIASYFGTKRTDPMVGSINIGLLANENMVVAHKERDVAVVMLTMHTPSNTMMMAHSENGGPSIPVTTLTNFPIVFDYHHVRLLDSIYPGGTSYVLGYPTSVTTKNTGTLDLDPAPVGDGETGCGGSDRRSVRP